MVTVDELASFDLFSGASARVLECLAKSAEVKQFPSGAKIFEEGQPGGELCLIKEGLVRISLRIRDEETQALKTLEKGMFFGGVSFIDGKVHSASAFAVNDVTTISIRRKVFDQLVDGDHVSAINILLLLLVSICFSLREMDKKFVDVIQYISRNK